MGNVKSELEKLTKNITNIGKAEVPLKKNVSRLRDIGDSWKSKLEKFFIGQPVEELLHSDFLSVGFPCPEIFFTYFFCQTLLVEVVKVSGLCAGYK